MNRAASRFRFIALAVSLLCFAGKTWGQISFQFQDFEGSAPPTNGGDGTSPDPDGYPQEGKGPTVISLDSSDAMSGSKSLRFTVNAGTTYPAWWAFNYGGYKSGVTSPRGFAREFAENPSGWQFNTYNRLTFWIKAPTNASQSSDEGHNVELGTYVKRVQNADPYSDETGGGHYYHFFNIQPTDTWTKVVVNMHPNHQRGGVGSYEWGNLPYPTGESQYNYWDVFTSFYFEFDPYVTSFGTYPKVYKFDGFEFYKEPYQENDDQVYNIAATYVLAEKKIIMSWSRNKNEETINHEVRYSFSNIHEIGWNAATPAPGGILIPNGYQGMTYKSTAIPTGSNQKIYLAIKPQNSLLFSQIEIPLTVGPPGNTAPVANSQTVTTSENTAVVVTLTATDADGDALSYTVVSNPANGALSGTAPDLLYTPNLNFSGADSFTFKANDGQADSNIATVTITVGYLFLDDFEDGALDLNWTYSKNISFWSEDGASLIGTNPDKKTTAVANPVFAGCTNCYVETVMSTGGGPFNKIWLLFHVQDPKTDLVELLAKEEADKWVLKHRIGKTVVAKQKFESAIDPDVFYTARIRYDGVNYIASTNGVDIITLPPGGPVAGGTVGLKVKKTVGTFQRIEVN